MHRAILISLRNFSGSTQAHSSTRVRLLAGFVCFYTVFTGLVFITTHVVEMVETSHTITLIHHTYPASHGAIFLWGVQLIPGPLKSTALAPLQRVHECVYACV